MTQYDNDQLKQAEKQTQTYVDLRRDEWLWDEESAAIETLKADEKEEVVRMDWREVTGSPKLRAFGMVALAALVFGTLATAGAGYSSLWVLFMLPMFMGGRGTTRPDSDWGKWLLWMLFFNLILNGGFGFLWLLLLIPFLNSGRRQRAY